MSPAAAAVAAIAEIEAILRARIGLDVDTIGRSSLELAVAARSRALRLGDAEAYLRTLRADAAEAQLLCEEVVVPETWFFRDGEPFAHLARRAAAWIRRHPQGTFRVLSAPCSSGEEPYSVAMSLLDHGLPLERMEIDAVDVSRRLIAAAERGVYPAHSFRGKSIDFRDRHFSGEGQEWRLAAAVREAVRFRVGNLLEPGGLGEPERRYHAIFCRNLFIYLARDVRVQLMQALDRQLEEEGVIYVGHAEALEGIDARYRPLGDSGAFAYARGVARSRPAADAAPRLPARPAPSRLSTPPPVAALVTPSALAPAPLPEPPPPPAASAPVAAAASLEGAARLADLGKLAEAASSCERFLADKGPDAAAYELLGVVRMALGDDGRAEQCFERALYLDARRYQSLVHLALLYERRGNAAGAANLRRRADALRANAGERR